MKIMSNCCEDCGCKVYSGRCTNCHEELFILDQYDELSGTEYELPYPDENSDFMKKVNEFKKKAMDPNNIKQNRRFSCLKCKTEVDYLAEDIDIMERAEKNEGVFCSSECEYSFYKGGDGSDY